MLMVSKNIFAGEVEDKPQVLPMPENMPEHLKKILDMGFPGCPIFQRMPKPPGGAVQQVENLGLAEPAEGFLEGAGEPTLFGMNVFHGVHFVRHL